MPGPDPVVVSSTSVQCGVLARPLVAWVHARLVRESWLLSGPGAIEPVVSEGFMAGSTSLGGPDQVSGLTTGETAEKRKWRAPGGNVFEHDLSVALAGAEDFEYRKNLGLQSRFLMERAWELSEKAHHHSGLWKPFRYAGEVIPVVAAGAGGSLISHVDGTAATVIGWVALIGGLLGAAINAMHPADGYGARLRTAAHFEQLFWDMQNYVMTELRDARHEDISFAMRKFAQRMNDIAVSPASGGPS